MSSDSPAFDELTTALATGGTSAALTALAAQLAAAESFHELFDARLMESRHRLGLPLMQSTSIDDLPAETREPLEAAYLEACREVGGRFLEQGRIREAWMYLRPVGDKPSLAAALRKLEPTDDQVEALIEIALHEGIDPELGFRLVLERYGVCNAISLFDAAGGRLPLAQRQQLAAQLVRQLHRDLTANVQADIARRAGGELHAAAGAESPGAVDADATSSASLAELLAGRDDLFADDNYHIDTSHLSAVVRASRLTTDPDVLRLAVDLTEYGRRLSPAYRYPGEPPFEDLYPQSAQFLRAELGEDVDAAVAYFGERARSTDVWQSGTGPAEVHIALLARLERWSEAMAAAVELLPPGVTPTGFAPSLLELARQAGDYRLLIEQSRQQGNLLTFAAGILETARLRGGAPHG